MAAEPEILEFETVPSGESLLRKAFLDEVPIVVFLGQSAGWSVEHPDPVLALALQRASRIGNDWSANTAVAIDCSKRATKLTKCS
jgi:hypothetical protein